MIEKIRGFLFGPKPKEKPCPVCGGTMVERKKFPPDPYWDIVLQCGECDAFSDGITIKTNVPREKWAGNTKTVDFGGGRAPHNDADINIDKEDYPETDICCDLDEGIPLDSDSVGKAYAHNIIEHLRSPFNFLEELIRVCQDGAGVSVRFPVPEHENAVKDDEHRYILTPRWFDLFDEIEVVENEKHYPSPRLGVLDFLPIKEAQPDEYRLKLRVRK